MATKLTRAVVRETAVVEQRTGRPLVVTLEEGGHLLRIRPKGTRTSYSMTYEQLFVLGAQNEVSKMRAEGPSRKSPVSRNLLR